MDVKHMDVKHMTVKHMTVKHMDVKHMDVGPALVEVIPLVEAIMVEVGPAMVEVISAIVEAIMVMVDVKKVLCNSNARVKSIVGGVPTTDDTFVNTYVDVNDFVSVDL